MKRTLLNKKYIRFNQMTLLVCSNSVRYWAPSSRIWLQNRVNFWSV